MELKSRFEVSLEYHFFVFSMITFSNRNAVILWWLLLFITPTSSSINPSSPLAHSKNRIFDHRSSAKSPPLRLSLLAFSAPPTTLRRTPSQWNIREYTTSPTTAYPQPPSLQKSTQLHLPPRSHSTRLHSFLGSDGGILGVGAPELATIVLIGTMRRSMRSTPLSFSSLRCF